MKILKIRIKYFMLGLVAIATKPIAKLFYTKLAMFDSTPDEVVKALDKITQQVNEQGQKAIEEAKRGIKMAEGQKAQIDELLEKQGSFQAQIKALEQAAARQGAAAQSEKSMGQQFIENERVKALHDKGERLQKGESLSISVKAITSATGTAAGNVGQAISPDRRTEINRIPDRRMTIRDLVSPGSTSSGVIIYPKETGYTNNAAVVAEGTRKPESTINMVAVTETVKKVATFMKASSEILADLPQLMSFIDYRLRYMLEFREEAQLLLGSGTGNNLNGIYTQATAYALPTGAATPTTTIDKLRMALLQASLAEFPSDGLVLHPTDWANIEVQKDTQGRYIIGNPQGTLSPTLWSRPVVATQAMAVGTFLAGAFKLGAQIFDRETANVVIATENEDDFVNNLVTILIEERLALAVYRPEAFVKGAIAVA